MYIVVVIFRKVEGYDNDNDKLGEGDRHTGVRGMPQENT